MCVCVCVCVCVSLCVDVCLCDESIPQTVDVITKHFVERCGNMGIAEPLLGTFRFGLNYSYYGTP